MILDMQTLGELQELMGDGMADLVDKYDELSQRYIQSIQKGIELGDAAMIEQAAHPLKSSSMQLAAIKVYEMARVVEAEAHTHHTVTPALREAAAGLPSALDGAMMALRQAVAA